ncbi:hypothetical protein [Nannocystis bainbridge]|uniref:Uncharacterized protein n=1 Tax=Nannocystis bainbridge TaxID=2995303 RepID=A0ABT5E6C8_9BACT|nr:hypothetical protein [Nannocystis bainbridge]MDC0721409.1 hypothetical protein [Nannocystis bainbridge]
MLVGSFCDRCRDRTLALVAGSVLLGEGEEGFEGSHEHGVGDVCPSPGLSASLLAAVASKSAAPGRLFATPALAPRPRISALARALAAATRSPDPTDAPEVEALALTLTAGCSESWLFRQVRAGPRRGARARASKLAFQSCANGHVRKVI